MEKNQKQEEPIAFLLKSMKKEYVHDTMTKGRFCFNHPTVFSKWENPNSAQHDRWEAHDAYEVTNLMVAPIIEERKDKMIYGAARKLADKGTVHMQNNSVKHTPICCFRCVFQSEIELYGDTMFYSLGKVADRIMQEFGHDAYVMIQLSPFLERLKEKAEIFACGRIVYRNLLNDYQFNVPEQYKEVIGQLFRKDEQFEWQKEYRIVLPPTVNAPVFIELSSIEDIAFCGDIADLRN